jgi:hypothetical protein
MAAIHLSYRVGKGGPGIGEIIAIDKRYVCKGKKKREFLGSLGWFV